MQELRKRDESAAKEFVDVCCLYSSADGSITPTSFFRDDGSEHSIDKVLDVCRAASLRIGGAGIRYTVRTYLPEEDRSVIIFLFLDDKYWFIERSCCREAANGNGAPPHGTAPQTERRRLICAQDM